MRMKTILLLILATITLWSCSTDDSNALTDNLDNGVILSIADTTSNVIFNDNLDGGVDINLEYRDSENGVLLDKVDVFITFVDATGDVGDSTNAILDEILLRTIDDTSFSNGVNDFPIHNLLITTQDFLDITNNTLDGIASGDDFITRFELTLTDGRVFSINNTANNGGLINDFSFTTPVE